MNNTASQLSDSLLKHKKDCIHNGYLLFNLANTSYALNVHHIINFIEKPNLIYMSHMIPPIIGLQYYQNKLIPVMDFAGYRPYKKNAKLLILSESPLRTCNLFALVVDDILNLQYIKAKDLKNNKLPYNNLLPSYFYTSKKNTIIHLLDIHDLSNQLD